MPSWLPLIILVVIIFAISPILNNRAIQIHGPAVNLAIINIIFFILGLFWLILIEWQDIFLISKKSLILTSIAGAGTFIGIAILFSVYRAAPKELSIITITMSFSVVMLAIINHFLGDKLAFHQWIGAIITFLGIALIHYKK